MLINSQVYVEQFSTYNQNLSLEILFFLFMVSELWSETELKTPTLVCLVWVPRLDLRFIVTGRKSEEVRVLSGQV